MYKVYYAKVQDFLEDIFCKKEVQFPVTIGDIELTCSQDFLNALLCEKDVMSITTTKKLAVTIQHMLTTNSTINQKSNDIKIKYLSSELADYMGSITDINAEYNKVYSLTPMQKWYQSVLTEGVSYHDALLKNRELLHLQRLSMFIKCLVKGKPALIHYIDCYNNPTKYMHNTDFSKFSIPYHKQSKNAYEYLKRGLHMLCQMYYKDISYSDLTIDVILSSIVKLVDEYCNKFKGIDRESLITIIFARSLDKDKLPIGLCTTFYRNSFIYAYDTSYKLPTIQQLINLYGKDNLNRLTSFTTIIKAIDNFLEESIEIDKISKKMPINLLSVIKPVRIYENLSLYNSLCHYLQCPNEQELIDSVSYTFKQFAHEISRFKEFSLKLVSSRTTDNYKRQSSICDATYYLKGIRDILCNMIILNKTISKEMPIVSHMDNIKQTTITLNLLIESLRRIQQSIDLEVLEHYEEIYLTSLSDNLRISEKSLIKSYRNIYYNIEDLWSIYKENPIRW